MSLWKSWFDRFRRLLAYPPLEISLFIFFGILLVVADLLIRFLPPKKTLIFFKSKFKPVTPTPSPLSSPSRGGEGRVKGWIRLLEAADRNLGWKPSCVRRALALKWILSCIAFPTELKIGVRCEGGSFEAHAWLESEGKVLEFGDVASAYRPLLKSVKKS